MNAAHAADLAFAASSSPGGGGSTAVATQLLFFAAIFAIFWFLLIRPQQKQKREREQMLAALKRGDRVVTSGGLHGTVTSLDEHKVVLRVADPVRLEGEATVVVELASPQSWNDALTAAAELQNFGRRDEDQAAGRFKLVMSERVVSRLRDDAVRQGLETIRNRVDQFGVAEPTITRQGSERILIQLPGIHDVARAKGLIGKTALLEFKLLDERVSAEEALKGNLPETDEILYQRRSDKETKSERKIPYVVQKRALLTGAELTRAEVQADPNSPGNWQVAIEFTATGARIFGEVTEANVGKHLAIVLDGNVYSAPRINERIPGGRAVITGQFTVDQARDLAIVLRAGALPAPVTILEERTVGPSLGADSIRQGLIAITMSAVVVFLFLLFYYRLSRLLADVALRLNLLLPLACMAAISATLTLPGLAGIALTVGMALDTNILIFERIPEELRGGETPP